MSGRRGTEGLSQDLAILRAHFRERWALYSRILDELEPLLAGPVLARLEKAWHERSFQAVYDRPLLLLAAMREDVLLEGESHPLWAALRDQSPDPHAVTRDALAATLERPRMWHSIAHRTIQTNDTSRAVCWVWPAHSIDQPLVLVDCGASAGLNLLADSLPPMWRDQSGATLPVVQQARTVARLGLDSHPLDLSNADERRWLRACMWAGEHDRIARFDVSLAAFDRLGAPRVERADATEFPSRIASLDADAFVLAYQSIFRDYLPPKVRAQYAVGMQNWLSTARRAAWIELEAVDPGSRTHPVAITAHLPGGRTLELARCAYHPSEIKIDPAAVAEFTSAVRS